MNSRNFNLLTDRDSTIFLHVEINAHVFASEKMWKT
jgi:hypothetical protein